MGKLNTANLWKRLDSDRITHRTLDLLCFTLCNCICTVYLDSGWIYTVGLDFFWIWNMEEDLRLLFVSFVLFHLESIGAKREGSAMVLDIGLRIGQSALGFPSFSFVYKCIVLPLFGSTAN